MPEPLFLAVDLGSSGLRVAVGRATGRPLAVSRRPVRSFRPPGTPELAREFEPAALLRSVALAASVALREARVRRRDLAAFAITSQREGIAMLDRAGRVLYAGPNTDLRGAFQGAAIDDSHSSLIWRTTGHLPSFMLAWSKLAWFRDEAPETFGTVAHVTSLADWLVYELTGELRLERSLGVEAGLSDLESGEPARALAGSLGFDPNLLPGAVDAGSVVGKVSPSAAEGYGLPDGLPVVNAGPDTQAGLAGLGIASPGETGVLAGWSGTVQMVTEQPVFDPDRGLWAGRHVVGSRHVLESNTGVMGGAYEWLAALTSGHGTQKPDYERLDRAASNAERGPGSVSAHLGPDALNMSRSSLRAGGILFPAPLALDPPDAGALGRASIENFAFAIRASLARLRAVSSRAVSRESTSRAEGPGAVTVGGGMVRSHAFRMVLADALGQPVRIGSPEASLLGAITLASSAIGFAPSPGRALSARARACRQVAPDPLAAEEYEFLYQQWRRRGDVLAGIGL